jgi:DNA-binding MarR family transcriptional regulator
LHLFVATNKMTAVSSTIQRYLKQNRPFRTVEEEVFLSIQVAADLLMEPWAAYLKEAADLTPAQYNVLRILRGAGDNGLWAGEIGERLITRSPDVTRLIDRLEKRKLVRRKPDATDRRAVRVHITDAGREQVAALDSKARTMLPSLLDRVPARKLTALRDELDTLLATLTDEDGG